MTNQRHLSLLKNDIKAWNYWRQENSDLTLDLSGVDLSGLNLNGVNLSGANLSGANLSGANLKCAYLKGANFYQANFIQANLKGSDLSEVNLTQANLTQANLSSANLQDANLAQAKVLLTNLSNAILTGACLEDWHVDRDTDLEALVCDYFYGKQEQQERYPQNELHNFAPGECRQFLTDYFNQKNFLVLANQNQARSPQNSQEKLDELRDIINNNEQEEREEIKQESAIPVISLSNQSKPKKSIIRFSVALLFGLIVTVIAIGQIFKKTTITETKLVNCDTTLLKEAEDAIFIRDEESLKQLIQQFQQFNTPLGELIDEECQQTLYELKYTYAIQIKALRDHSLFEAIELLCQLPEQYYQQKDNKPWFLRWSNSFAHTDFPQKLSEYLTANDCPAANYLNQTPVID